MRSFIFEMTTESKTISIKDKATYVRTHFMCRESDKQPRSNRNDRRRLRKKKL